ncbi:TRAP transporter substrate-binding protein [Vandammella animalimorsus]|uniref:C4-dicarboxylate ABC transporter substrate-binding protein n=1 Tax=Vandammella animalimorsus TaxID=2029117 RepID=A0A2A2A9N1_9BURK|nr:TRAP transporter substrate-binding protein [Vandammella animalimorsus]PAT34448.1 hypothetical protein CK620_09615 [Vandammella animalimorsus]
MKMVFKAFALSISLACGAALAQSKPVTFKFANFAGPTAYLTKGMYEPLAKDIEKDSQGTLKIKIYSGASLAKADEVFDAVRRGLVDMGWGVTGYMPGRFKAADIPEIPFQARTIKEASTGIWSLYEAGLMDGFEDVKVFALASSGILTAHSTEKIESLDDLKGQRIRAAGPLASASVEALGIIPVGLPVTQTAENLSKKILRGSLNDWNALYTWQVLDFVPWHVDAPMGSGTVFLVINKRSFDKLPEAAKSALEKHGGVNFIDRWSNGLENENQRLRKMLEDNPAHTIITPSDADIERWSKMVQPVIDHWTGSIENGPKIWQVYSDAIQEVRKAE